MDPIEAALARLDQAAGLPAVVDAAYEAFEEMLRAIEDQARLGIGHPRHGQSRIYQGTDP